MIYSLFFTLAIFNADSQVGGRTSPDGAEQLQIDLPASEHLKNVGGKDGSGLCVFTSVEHSGRWQNVEQLHGFQGKMRKEEGGGWPEKVDKMVAKYAPGTTYLQYSGDDTSLLKLALKTGRMPAVTYGYSPRYGGSGRIAHMVNLVHLTPKWAAILDNNFPGEDKYEWMAPAEFTRRWKLGGGGWAVFLLSPPPPPPPTANARYTQHTEPDEAPPPPATPEPFLFGVELTKTTEKGHWHNGRKISAIEAETILEGGTLTDDSHKLRITLIGDPEKTRRPKMDIEASEWGPSVLVQAYTADAWAVTAVGLPTTGTPRIVVQAPPGPDGSATVLHSQADYTDGIEGLIGALRRKAPNYDPTRDKDGRKGPDIAAPSTLALARAVTVTAIVAFILGWFAHRIVPAAVAAITTAHARTFPPKPTMEEMILSALKTLKAQEAANVDRTDPANKPS
jgi:hypothetical protein